MMLTKKPLRLFSNITHLIWDKNGSEKRVEECWTKVLKRRFRLLLINCTVISKNWDYKSEANRANNKYKDQTVLVKKIIF